MGITRSRFKPESSNRQNERERRGKKTNTTRTTVLRQKNINSKQNRVVRGPPWANVGRTRDGGGTALGTIVVARYTLTQQCRRRGHNYYGIEFNSRARVVETRIKRPAKGCDKKSGWKKTTTRTRVSYKYYERTMRILGRLTRGAQPLNCLFIRFGRREITIPGPATCP